GIGWRLNSTEGNPCHACLRRGPMHDLNLISGNRSSSHSSLVPWLLMQEHGIGFHEIRIDLFRSDAIEQLGLYSPSLQVPVLIHDDVKVWDPLPICEYISETFLEQRG